MSFVKFLFAVVGLVIVPLMLCIYGALWLFVTATNPALFQDKGGEVELSLSQPVTFQNSSSGAIMTIRYTLKTSAADNIQLESPNVVLDDTSDCIESGLVGKLYYCKRRLSTEIPGISPRIQVVDFIFFSQNGKLFVMWRSNWRLVSQ